MNKNNKGSAVYTCRKWHCPYWIFIQHT